MFGFGRVLRYIDGWFGGAQFQWRPFGVELGWTNECCMLRIQPVDATR